ncbi:hypothetical protein LGZ99_22110 [Photorhabdus temperata]|uniref:Nmad5 family putative nucleotide modification protein n=1 Tax=Photorhabdus temperata TaxID=574560 RepID=UPI0021D50CF1|nr:Nmad5 family putative nucleotide modification protein [Photorhabdus temperata]MCT8349820.1 hypothetical protein [Photorhabdus temperata]
MSKKLTKDLKKEIVNNALSLAGIEEGFKQIELDKCQLAKDIRVTALGGEDKVKYWDELYENILDQIKEFNRNIDRHIDIIGAESEEILVGFGGRQMWLAYGRDENENRIRLITPARDHCLFNAEHELSVRFTKIEEKLSELNNKKDEIKNNVYAILNSVTTTKKLVEVWPEAKDLIPSEEVRIINTSLSVKVEDLNKMIGIPKSED